MPREDAPDQPPLPFGDGQGERLVPLPERRVVRNVGEHDRCKAAVIFSQKSLTGGKSSSGSNINDVEAVAMGSARRREGDRRGSFSYLVIFLHETGLWPLALSYVPPDGPATIIRLTLLFE